MSCTEAVRPWCSCSSSERAGLSLTTRLHLKGLQLEAAAARVPLGSLEMGSAPLWCHSGLVGWFQLELGWGALWVPQRALQFKGIIMVG